MTQLSQAAQDVLRTVDVAATLRILEPQNCVDTAELAIRHAAPSSQPARLPSVPTPSRPGVDTEPK